MTTRYLWDPGGWLGGALLLALATSFAIGAASCGSNAMVCVADSVCRPGCAADPDCGGSGQAGQGGSGTAGSSGSTGTAGANAGVAGSTGVAGGTGLGGTSGGQTCGPPAITGQVSFTGVSTVAFNTVMPNVHHKRDIDQFEDGCYNELDFTFGYGAGCTLRVVARDCLDGQGRMKVQSVTFTADSQCPNFPDATEGTYTGNAAALDGSWIAMSMPGITERNVALSCTGGLFTVTLVGTLTASGSRTLNVGATSALTVNGMFASNARDAACPALCATGAGGSSGVSGRGGAGGVSGSSGAGGTGNLTGAGGRGGTGNAAGTGNTAGAAGTGSAGRGGASGSSGGAGAAAGAGGATPCPNCMPEVVQKCQSDESPTQTAVNIKIVNIGNQPINYSDLTVRYWFTHATVATPVLEIDYTQFIPKAAITARFTASYIEIGFTAAAGTLAAFDLSVGSGELWLRFHPSDFSAWNPSMADDYSYQSCTGSAYNVWMKTTAYVRGSLAWGVEPPP